MGKKNKLKKFEDLHRYPHVYENPDPVNPGLTAQDNVRVDLKGKWAGEHFRNKNPLTLELACGRGEYTVALSEAYPEVNFIGIDVKGARMWQGASIALEKGLANAAFLRTRIEQIDLFFAPGEVSEIWITFPDPFLRVSKSDKRLTSPRFLHLYRKILASAALVHLKTDDTTLYEYTLQVLRSDPACRIICHNADIYASPLAFDELRFKTHYEMEHLSDGRKIKYIRFCIN